MGFADVGGDRERRLTPRCLRSHCSLQVCSDGSALLVPDSRPVVDLQAVGSVEEYSGCVLSVQFILADSAQRCNDQCRESSSRLTFRKNQDLSSLCLVVQYLQDLPLQRSNRRVVLPAGRVRVPVLLQVLERISLFWKTPATFRPIQCWQPRHSHARTHAHTLCVRTQADFRISKQASAISP